MAKTLLRGEASWLVNIGISDRDAVKAQGHDLHYCRVYVFQEDRLLHLGEEFDVKLAYEVSSAVSAVLDAANL